MLSPVRSASGIPTGAHRRERAAATIQGALLVAPDCSGGPRDVARRDDDLAREPLLAGDPLVVWRSREAWRYVTQWQLLFAPAILIAVGYFVLFFHSRFAHDRATRRLAFGAIACWIVALLLEALRLTFRHAGANYYDWEVVVEELCEIVGGILLFAAVARYATGDGVNQIAGSDPRTTLRFSPGAVRALAVAVGVLVGGAVLNGLFVQRLARLDAPTPRLIERAERERTERLRPVSGVLPKPTFVSDLIGIPGLSVSSVADHLDRLRPTLFPTSAAPSTTPPALAVVVDDEPRMVFATAMGPERAVVVTALERGLEEALEQALASLTAEAARPQWIKIDVVDSVRSVAGSELLPIERGIDGLAFSGDVDVAFLPGEVLARTLVDSEGEIQPRNVARYLEEVSEGTVPSAADLPRALSEPLLFSTSSWLIDPIAVHPLVRGHRVFTAPSLDELNSAAKAAGSYLRRAVDPRGRFLYSYLPKTASTRDDYNILRHAGTVYSMLELYAADGDPEILAAAERALQYLLRQIQPCSVEVDGQHLTAACVVEEDEVKLGGNALAILAFSQHAAVTGDPTYLAPGAELARWVAGVQAVDGRFAVHKLQYSSGEPSDFVSGYYPGEAIFALARFSEATGDTAWLDVAERAATYLIDIRDADVPTEGLPHDHWLLYGLNTLHRHRPREKYAAHAARISSAILSRQNTTSPRWPDWRGSYYTPPRTTPTATRSEGLSAAYELARRTGREEEARRALEGIVAGVNFQLQNQFTPESAVYLPPPREATLGGFRKSLTDFEIRIDYVQHSLSSLLALQRILEAESVEEST